MTLQSPGRALASHPGVKARALCRFLTSELTPDAVVPGDGEALGAAAADSGALGVERTEV